MPDFICSRVLISLLRFVGCINRSQKLRTLHGPKLVTERNSRVLLDEERGFLGGP